MKDLNSGLKTKCKEVNLGKKILEQEKDNPLYDEINKISEANYKLLQQEY